MIQYEVLQPNSTGAEKLLVVYSCYSYSNLMAVAVHILVHHVVLTVATVLYEQQGNRHGIGCVTYLNCNEFNE